MRPGHFACGSIHFPRYSRWWVGWAYSSLRRSNPEAGCSWPMLLARSALDLPPTSYGHGGRESGLLPRVTWLSNRLVRDRNQNYRCAEYILSLSPQSSVSWYNSRRDGDETLTAGLESERKAFRQSAKKMQGDRWSN